MSQDPVDIVRAEACVRIAHAAATLSNATLERDAAIIHGRTVGLTVRTIATLAEVSPQTVLNIIDRNTP